MLTNFFQNYASIDVLLHRSRLTKLQSVQTFIEIQEFISFVSKQGNVQFIPTLVFFYNFGRALASDLFA